MHFKISNIKKTFLLFSFIFVGPVLFTGCMTSARQDQLQTSINNLQDQVTKIQNQLSSKDQQINSTTQTAIASQNETQGLRDQLQLTQGAVDEVKNKLKKIEENAGTNSSNGTNINNNNDIINSLQTKIARLELLTVSQLTNTRKGKLPKKIKNITDLNKALKSQYDNGKFKQVSELATTVLQARAATEQMLAVALEFRGEAKFQLKDYKEAAIDLAKLLEEFPNPPRKARALLLTGDSYVYLKNNPVALLYYQECVKNYATLPEGKAATSRLTNLLTQMNTPKPASSKVQN